MLALLLFSLLFVTIGSAEKLAQLRKSCIYADILTESSEFEWQLARIEYPSAHDWDSAIQYYCAKFNITRKASSIKPFSELLDDLKKDLGQWNGKRVGRHELKVIATLFENHTAHPDLWDRREEEIEELHYPMKPKAVLGNIVKNPECINKDGKDEIKFQVQMKRFELKRVWTCEDIGRKVNGSYEFYTIPKIWMFEDESGVTKMVNLKQCLRMDGKYQCANWRQCVQKNGKYQCAKKKSIHDAVCSVNSVEKCYKNRVNGRNKVHSYHRSLVGGTAIFGSFKKLTVYEEKQPNSLAIHPKLFYLGFGNSTLLTKNLDY